MIVSYKEAEIKDLAIVLPLIREFHEIEHLPYEEETLKKALGQMFDNPFLGRLWVIQYGEDAEAETAAVGYMMIGFGFSLEYYGRDALLDEFYVREQFRGKGIGSQALDFITLFCRNHGVRALHLEVDWVNGPARRLYLKSGFTDHKRHLMTKWIDGE